jgi:hypothetical protein
MGVDYHRVCKSGVIILSTLAMIVLGYVVNAERY